MSYEDWDYVNEGWDYEDSHPREQDTGRITLRGTLLACSLGLALGLAFVWTVLL